MASVVQEPEVQFAQRLASNEKSVRTKAIKKLRKYLSVRSQKPDGGFSIDELLKIWKGLFYCLWMQDKPLLQEELSNQISGLIHWLQNVDTQFLFLESFLRTINREWNGIDRLRMDKFYSLVRFVFREAFEMLKKRDWDDGLIGRFLELLSALVLRSTSDTPKGVQFHVLDIYMTELARVGSAQLTAKQNLAFIEPFCKTASRSKDHILVEAICSSMFQEMVEQAPFAIDDLMRELRSGGGGGSDSEEDSEAEQDKGTTKAAKLNGPRKIGGKPVNGVTSTDDDDDDDDDDENLMEEEDDGLPDWGEDSDVRADHEAAGPVLQFDYQAVGDRLFALASRNNTPSFNRKKLYQLVRTFRNLSKGIFPQDDYPPEVSTDEDDDMFASRKKMKKKRRRNTEDQLEEEADEEGLSAVKKRKVKKDGEKPAKSAQKTAGTPNDGADTKKKKKRQKKKKKNAAATAEGENLPAVEVSEKHPAPQMTATAAECLEIGVQSSPLTEALNQSETGTETPKHCLIGAKGDVADIQPESQSETLSTDGSASGKSGEKRNKRKRKRAGGDGGNVVLMEDCERPPAVQSGPTEGKGAVADRQAESQSETLSTDCAALGKATEKRNKKKKKARGGDKNVAALEDSEMPPARQTIPTEEERAVADAQAESKSETLSTDCAVAGKGASKKNKSKKRRTRLNMEAPEPDSVGPNTDTSVAAVSGSGGEASQSAPASEKRVVPDEAEAATPLLPTANGKRSKKKKNKKVSEQESSSPAVAEELTQADAGSDGHLSDSSPAARLKKRKRKKVSGTRDEGEATGAKAARLNGHVTAAETVAVGEKAAASSESDAVPALTGTKKTQKKKKKAVVKASPGGASDFMQFQSPVVPTPLFCRAAKGGPSTPTPRKQLSLTSLSESKKVTFGLKNNQTAEFKKTDRSLMVSPDGSSRVPFDPQQKPLFGVLKSPNVVGPQATKNKNGNSSTGRRPTAADFF